jgi:predicted DNA-binding transcriptional regulator YafY
VEGSAGYRDKMRDECVQMHNILRTRRRVELRAIVDELGIHPRTVRRWVKSFSFIMPLRIDHGTVVVEEDVL